MKKLKLMLLIGLIALSMGLAGCAGDDGTNGVTTTKLDTAAADALQAQLDALANAPAVAANESCNVCHKAGAIADFDYKHNFNLDGTVKIVRQNLTATITEVSNVGGFPVVKFSVFAGTAPVTDLAVGDLRVVMADIIPAGTPTVDLDSADVAPADGVPDGIKIYGSDYLENWMYETGTGSIVAGAGAGDYVYTSDIAFGGLSAVRANNYEYSAANAKRIYMRVGSNTWPEFNRFGATFDITAEPAASVVATQIDMQDQYVTFETCKSCHGEQMDKAAHADSYYTISCGLCHSPISGRAAGTRAAFTASMIHRIHAAIDIPEFPTRINGNGYADVTYPKNIKDCTVCHTTVGADTTGIDLTTMDNWKNNPTAEVCTTCHQDSTLSVNATTNKFEITHSAPAVAKGAPATVRANGSCTFCHVADDIAVYHTVTELKSADVPTLLAPVYDATIALSAVDADGNATATDGVLVAGDVITVTVTTDVAGTDYTADYSGASLYVYGPRAKAVPVLTTGSTTDPAFIAAFALDPTTKMVQSHSMTADASGFKLTLQAIPADLAPGTYMVQVAVKHKTLGRTPNPTSAHAYNIDGWELTTIQIGAAGDAVADEPKVAGECTSCHDQSDWSSMYHRSYFGTDGCLACHDQSTGNSGDPIANRVHAVHAASQTGDLKGLAWDGSSADLPYVSYPQEALRCEACHNSVNDSFSTKPAAWGVPCIGCHGDVEGAKDHMIQNGSSF